MTMPKISVILPAYNAENYISQAIDSILAQTYGDFEFIILNDCSTDGTERIILSFDDPRIRYVRNEQNLGVAATLNRGLELAAGEYIARMDADDISLPERFFRQVSYLDVHPEIAVLGTDIRLIGAGSGIRSFSQTPERLKTDLLFDCCFAHPAVMMRRQAILSLGGYDPDFNGAEDYHLWARCVMAGYQLACLPEVLLCYRIHPGQVTQAPSPKSAALADQIRTMQIRAIGLDVCSEEFSAFCHPSQDNLPLCAAYMKTLQKAARGYDGPYLRRSCKAILRKKLDLLPVSRALALCPRCGMSPLDPLLRRSKEKLRQILGQFPVRRKLKNRDFTIFSNNCWAGTIYQSAGLPYGTPTVGLFFPGDDFVKFCANWQHYTTAPLEFIPWEQARLYPLLKDQTPYPVARLEDIEVYFMHYATQAEAREKWIRRCSRINPDRLVFKLSQRESCGREVVEQFLALPHPNKICFSHDPVPGAIHIPELKGLHGDESLYTSQAFDPIGYLNQL